MPLSGPVTRHRWLSGRAVALHLALLLALPLCAIAAWWQVDRALSGNALSWLYVLEWPAFAGIGIWLWWVLLTITPAARPELAGGEGAEPAPVAAPALRWDPSEEAAPLMAYNRYLAELNAGRKASRPKTAASWRHRGATVAKAEARPS